MENTKLKSFREVEDLYLVVSTHIANNHIPKITDYLNTHVYNDSYLLDIGYFN